MSKRLQNALDDLCQDFNTQQQETVDGVAAICPHCGRDAVFTQIDNRNVTGWVQRLVSTRAIDRTIFQACCPSKKCQGVVLISSAYEITDDHENRLSLKVLWPEDVRPSRAPVELDPEAMQDYDECRKVLSASPSAAATLARRCVQYVIRTKLGVRKRKLVDEIKEAVSKPDLSVPTREALDHVRSIGNLGAHPDLDETNSLLRVSHHEASYTIDVLELLFDDLYFKPAKIAEMSNKLGKNKA